MNWRTWALMMMVMIDGAIGVVNVVIVMNRGIVVRNNNGDGFKSSHQKWWWWWSFSKFFLNPSLTHTHNNACIEKQGNINKRERKTKGRKRSETNAQVVIISNNGDKLRSSNCNRQWWWSYSFQTLVTHDNEIT